MVMATIPQQRETARAVACRRNTMEIGQGPALDAEEDGVYPSISDFGPIEVPIGPGPLSAMLTASGLENLCGLGDPGRLSSRAQGIDPREPRKIPNILGPSDPNATSARFPAPLYDRAVAGGPPDGRTGPFVPGRRITPAEVEAADGLALTPSFAERPVGEGQIRSMCPANYALGPGPVKVWPPFLGVLVRRLAERRWLILGRGRSAIES